MQEVYLAIGLRREGSDISVHLALIRKDGAILQVLEEYRFPASLDEAPVLRFGPIRNLRGEVLDRGLTFPITDDEPEDR